MLKSWMKKSFVIGMSVTLLVPTFSHAYGEASVIQQYVGKDVLVPLIKPSWGNFILHTDTLNKFYSLRGHQAVWVDSNGAPTALVAALRNVLLTADRHGLNPADYWDKDVEGLYNATLKNPANWITFELAATEAMIRYATHLSSGRFDPRMIDDDMRFTKKEFVDYVELITAVSYGPSALPGALENFAPNNKRYRDLKDMLAQLRERKAAGGYEDLKSPGFALKKNVSDPIIMKLRQRFNLMGYPISLAGGNLFDDEFDAVLRKFQRQNGMSEDGVIGANNSEVLRALNIPTSQRIAQVEVSMEKLRWIPRTIEPTHIFVNLATTEFRLYEENVLRFYFRTVNGHPIRRTPTMRDRMTHVNLNPYWTVPESITIRAKLPEIKKDINYIYRSNMMVVKSFVENGKYREQEISPYEVDWHNIREEVDLRRRSIFLRQKPGADNALGVVKFPLVQNNDSIYLHDTNEKHLFAEKNRHQSSGCVRLQQPLELAEYLLRDVPGWDINAIRAYVPFYSNYIPGELDKKVYMKREMPVYLMYITAEKGESGEMRFVNDPYGQDLRVMKAIKNTRHNGELF